jgi:hypothetical protein
MGPYTGFLQDFLMGTVNVFRDSKAEPQQEEAAAMKPVSRG